MYHIEESRDIELINTVLFDDNIYPYFVTDNSLQRHMKVLIDDKLRFFIFFYGKIPIGICAFVEINCKISITHIGILKEHRGKEIYKLAKEMLRIYFRETDCEKIVCRIRKYNKKSIFFAIQNGFKVLGENGTYKYLEVNKNGRFI